MTRSTAGLYELYERGLLPAIQHSAAGRAKLVEVGGQKMYVPDFHEASVGLKIFSDTIVFYAKDDSLTSFLSIVNASFMLLQFGFGGGKYPIRGAIAHGDFILDEVRSILLGTAIEDAYAAEQSQVWAGCMLASSCSVLAEERDYISAFRALHDQGAEEATDAKEKLNIRENSRRLVRYKVPLQSSIKPEPTRYFEKEAYVIDWTIRMYEGATRASFDESENMHARRILDNTKRFEEWARTSNR